MSRYIVCRLKGTNVLINYRTIINGFDTRILNAHCSSNCYKASVLIGCHNYCTQHPSKPQPLIIGSQMSKSDSNTSSSISPRIPKISALVNEAEKLSSGSSKIIVHGKSLFRRQWDAFWNWYDEVSHTNEVRQAHKQVEELQEKLNEAQQLRRDISKELTDVRYELQMCFADQVNCQKGDPRYLELIRREIEISNKEKQKNEEFLLLDKAERDLFILMQAAVKTSHEKENIHTNSAKYWSIVGSLAGALLGICGTAFSFYNRNDLLSDINKEFVVIRNDTKLISEQIQLMVTEQREFLQEQRKRELSKALIPITNSGASNNESWLHWIGRKTCDYLL